MRFSSLLAAVTAFSGSSFAQSSSWSDWAPGQPVTTTITMTLLHVNETMTRTSQLPSETTSYTSTGTASNVVVNATQPVYTKPTSAVLTTTAAIATFSTGAAVIQEVNVAIAAIAGIGAVAYGLC